MPISATVLADSIAPCGKRLTTMEWTYPRAIHSEIMTHRMLSKNSASSRAIPVEKLIQRVLDHPWIPDYIGANQKGMQAGAELDEVARGFAVGTWLHARDEAVSHARRMVEIGVHKQVVNRLLEPWMYITIIVSATEWNNFFTLRLHKDAEPHFQALARAARAVMDASVPEKLEEGQWHLPLISGEDRLIVSTSLPTPLPDDSHVQFTKNLIKVSVGRCARVSYLTHDGRRDIAEDIALHDRLIVQEPLHASPAEHVAQALATPDRHGNLIGWRSYRMTLPKENVPG